jgi:sugar/nucleoside kinase (ribokinase family)
MKKYDVYAIGNALVDIEYHATAHKLVELGIDKGVMTLIDEQRQNSLVAQLGESHESMACGGSAANTIIALAQMGARTHLDCRVSSDMTGQVFARDLHDSGVNSNLDFKPLPVGVTGKCLVFVTPDADRTMNTFLGVSAELDSSDIDVEAIKHSEYIYIEGYLASAENPNMVKFFRESLEAMIGDKVDLLFANEDEAMELANTDDLDEAVQLFKKLSRSFAITRGREGALLFDGVALIEVKPNQVQAIDTLGAGDMFAGAFLYGLSQGMSFHQSGDLASLASAKIVTQYGPRLRATQTSALLESFNAGN